MKIIEFNGARLSVSDEGVITREERTFVQRSALGSYERTIPAKVLVPTSNGRAGYYQIAVTNNNLPKRCYVHRLVWEAFNGAIPDGYEIDHIDENKANNSLANLRLVTRHENMQKMRNSNSHVKKNLKQYR